MPVFKTRPGEGKINNFGLDFDEVGTDVPEGEIADRLRRHPQFEEVVSVSRETVTAPAPDPEQTGEIKRKPGRQPYPRDENNNPIKPVKTDV